MRISGTGGNSAYLSMALSEAGMLKCSALNATMSLLWIWNIDDAQRIAKGPRFSAVPWSRRRNELERRVGRRS
ncbi:MAG: hypothetical protein A2Y38_12335 [Spirochaetes bacterium GWB1_59_5]|nr:MAG: hypothetical protein A2Y38_12335 [Spirochaetes bacterium GWB1_59_5]